MELNHKLQGMCEMAGIVRINIQSDWNSWRIKMSRDLAPTADKLYRNIFNGINMPLRSGNDSITCTKFEAMSRYDWEEGIDCILYFENGTKATMQEKYLTYHNSTITFEENKTSGVPGAWYYCTAQYYFVGYARNYKLNNVFDFQDWILVDLPAIHRKDAAYELPWKFNRNNKDGSRATFRYLNFGDVPDDCIVAREYNHP